MPLNTPPLGYTGEQVEFSTTPTVKPGIVRAATAAEAAAGTRTDVFISPATADSATALDFASPPVLGYGSTTPRPVAATTITSTSITSASGGITATTGNITAAAGNIEATLGSVSAGTTVAAGTTVSAGTSVSATTSVTAGTTVTATLGNITATNGNLVLNTAGNKIVSTSVASTTTAGANSFGTVTLVGGTATVSTTAVTANSIIILTRQSVGATGAAALGELSVGTITASTSFVINAWSQADATALAATDVSSIGWMIIN